VKKKIIAVVLGLASSLAVSIGVALLFVTLDHHYGKPSGDGLEEFNLLTKAVASGAVIGLICLLFSTRYFYGRLRSRVASLPNSP
jgi:peptidoglycan biosynthesis protein MviN/MurJ (putative lipid II flippase)